MEFKSNIKIENQLESEITRGRCWMCPKNENGICDVTEEPIGSGDEYCEQVSLRD